MKPFRIAGYSAGASAACFALAMTRGDLTCAGELTATLIGLFFLFALLALIFLIVGVVQRARRKVVEES